MGYHFLTKCLYGEKREEHCDKSGAISFPIYQTATFAHQDNDTNTGYDYSRLQNPTREHLEKVVSSLENGIKTFAFSSGMAGIATTMELFKTGDHIIIDNDLYGGSIRLFHNISKKNGLKITNINCSCSEIEQLDRKSVG